MDRLESNSVLLVNTILSVSPSAFLALSLLAFFMSRRHAVTPHRSVRWKFQLFTQRCLGMDLWRSQPPQIPAQLVSASRSWYVMNDHDMSRFCHFWIFEDKVHFWVTMRSGLSIEVASIDTTSHPSTFIVLGLRFRLLQLPFGTVLVELWLNIKHAYFCVYVLCEMVEFKSWIQRGVQS